MPVLPMAPICLPSTAVSTLPPLILKRSWAVAAVTEVPSHPFSRKLENAPTRILGQSENTGQGPQAALCGMPAGAPGNLKCKAAHKEDKKEEEMLGVSEQKR